MFVDVKVRVETDHYKGRQGSNMRAQKFFFWIRESNFVGEPFREQF